MEHVICQVSELQERKPLAVELNGKELGVILSKGEVYAYANNCPHLGGPICLGDVFAAVKLKLNDQKMAVGEYTDENDLRLVCPWHAYEFELETGRCTVNPELKVRKYDAYIKDGQVIIKLG